MSVDADFLHPCNHVNGKYLSNTCPVCLGTNFYFDIVLSQSGTSIPVNGVNKTVQGLIHLLLTEEGTYNEYQYPEYESRTLRFVGSKNMDENRLKYQVLRDIEYYVSIKEKQNFTYANITEDEVIRKIISIKTKNDSDLQSVEIAAAIGEETRIQFFKYDRFVV